VAGIDVEAHQVHLTDEQTLSYDYLVLALGGEAPLDIVPGAAEHAIPFHALSHAYRLEERLRQLEQSDLDKIRVAIAGAGYSGVELACKLADRLGSRGRIRLIDRGDDILSTSPEFNRRAAYQALSERNVWIDLETLVDAVESDSISLRYRDQIDTIPAEIVLWTVGTRVAEPIRVLPIPKTEQDRVKVSSTLQVLDHPDLFALGDLADCKDVTGQQVPTTAQAAFQQADYVAWNIWAMTTGDRPLLSFKYEHLGEIMTLGTDNATLTGLGLQMDGTFAYVARRLAYLYRMPTLDHQIKVGLNWISQPFRDFLAPSQTGNG
jgi:NADH dehydrogenase